MIRRVVILGATGLVGNSLLQLFLSEDTSISKKEMSPWSYSIDQVITLTRAPLTSSGKHLNVVIDFNQLDSTDHWSAIFQDADVYCCLGSTIAKSGNQAEFYKIDHDLVLKLARLAQRHQAAKFALVSSVGSSVTARSFYLRTKAQVEIDLMKLNFSTLHIFRPSLLLGKRAEFRLWESIFQKILPTLNFLFWGPWRKYRPVSAKDVAQKMIQAMSSRDTGVFYHYF